MAETALVLRRGDRVRLVCVKAPVICRAEGVKLWEAGDEVEVILTGFWEGLLERGEVRLWTPPPVEGVLLDLSVEPSPEPPGQGHGETVSVGRKGRKDGRS